MATLVEVVCPEGVGEGDMIQVEHCGQSFDVPLPAGVAAGCAFQVELPELIEPPLDLSGLSMDAPTEPAETETEAEKQKAKLKIIEDAMAAGRLTSDQACLLQYLMESLYDFDALDDFIDAHARQFEEYEKDGEQRLEWTMTHQRYVTMVEGHIADELEVQAPHPPAPADWRLGLPLLTRASSPRTSVGMRPVYIPSSRRPLKATTEPAPSSHASSAWAVPPAMPPAAPASSSHPRSPWRAPLSVPRFPPADYDLFCRSMKAGGGSLKVSLQDLEKLGGTYSAFGGDEDEDEDEE